MKLIEFQKITTILAKEHKITIQEGKSWSANITNRIVYYKKNDIFNLPEEHILGLILHEIAHINYTTNVEMPKENPELSHATLNVIEDISIEHIISNDYPNAGSILESTKDEVLEKLIEILPKLEITIFEKSLLFASLKFERKETKPNKEKYQQIGEAIAKIMIKRKKEIYNRKETKDLMPLVKEIVDLIITKAGKPTEQEKQKLKSNAETEGNGKESYDENEIKKNLIKKLKGVGRLWGGKEKEINENLELINEIADQANIIGKQIKTVLKRNNSMEFGGKYRTGKLLTKRLTKIKTIKDRHPFSRRIIKSNKSYAFAIASDVSGSMFSGGTKNNASYALTSMLMVGEALKQANIPRTMIVFGKNAEIITRINKKQIIWEDLINASKIRKAGQGDTNINKAIKLCTEELKNIKAERKIMIILTDGCSDTYTMKQEHKEATKNGIECLGITIGSDGSSRYMDEVFTKEKNIKIENTNQPQLIGKAFIDILKTSIKLSPQ
jgi:predicted metal-dependent peptidase